MKNVQIINEEKWIDIRNRFPEQEGDYLVKILEINMNPQILVKVVHGKPYTFEHFGNIYHGFEWQGMHSNLKVTHWMSLDSDSKKNLI